jgi:serine/threonine protein phosphatase 1
MKTWIIPDVHGCLLTLKSLVETLIRPQAGDRLIFLGDYIDRGPDSKGVIDYVMQLQQMDLQVTTLRGNHEDYLLKVLDESEHKSIRKMMGLKGKMHREWLFHGGKEALASFGVKHASGIPEHYIRWISNLDYYVETGKFLIVHAGFNFKQDNIFADKQTMMWSKEWEVDTGKLAGRTIVHGHVPVTLEFIYQCFENSHYGFFALDNGVYMANQPGYGNLTALELGSLELLIQPNLDM